MSPAAYGAYQTPWFTTQRVLAGPIWFMRPNTARPELDRPASLVTDDFGRLVRTNLNQAVFSLSGGHR